MLKKIVCALLVSSFLISCTAQPTQKPNTTPSSQGYPAPTQSGYPVPDVGRTAYPAVTGDTPAALPKNLEPASKTVGTVKGKLIHTTEKTNLFPSAYLGSIKNDTKGNPTIASLDKNNDPKAVVDANGNFAFLNVKPGKYILMVDVIHSIVSLSVNGKEQVLEVVGGKVLDVGDVSIP